MQYFLIGYATNQSIAKTSFGEFQDVLPGRSLGKESIYLSYLAPNSTRMNNCCCKIICSLGHPVIFNF